MFCLFHFVKVEFIKITIYDMAFPESDRIIFANNPLQKVICQLQFPEILKIASELPSNFQDRIRSQYPYYGEEKVQIPEGISRIVEQLSNIGSLKTPEGPNHKFASENKKKYVNLTQGFIALTDNGYKSWESFSEEMNLVAKALDEEYKPNFYTRIGLRYIDIIEREKIGLGGIEWSELLNPALIGLLGDTTLQTAPARIISEAEFDIRIEGLSKVRLRHGLIYKNHQEQYLIDTDCYTEERSEFDAIPSILKSFNRTAGDLFRWTLTPKLRDALGPE